MLYHHATHNDEVMIHSIAERFNESMFEVYQLYAMSICHVCGSYQCPYCPVFSHSGPMLRATYFILGPVLAIFILLRAAATER